MSLNSRLEKIERSRAPASPHGRVVLYDPGEQEMPTAEPPAGVVILIPKNGRELTDKKKP